MSTGKNIEVFARIRPPPPDVLEDIVAPTTPAKTATKSSATSKATASWKQKGTNDAKSTTKAKLKIAVECTNTSVKTINPDEFIRTREKDFLLDRVFGATATQEEV